MFNPQPKQGNSKCKKLTQASKGMTCIRCDAPDAYACHYNGDYQHKYGKGRGIKCHDLMTADFCHRCDQLFSEGNKNNFPIEENRDEIFFDYINLTNIRRFNNGVLKV
jgi:hypothetical protein